MIEEKKERLQLMGMGFLLGASWMLVFVLIAQQIWN